MINKLRKLVLTDQNKDTKTEALSNWSYFHLILTGITDENEVLEYLLVEIQTKQRMHIISRLTSAYRRLCKLRETKDLEDFINGNGKAE